MSALQGLAEKRAKAYNLLSFFFLERPGPKLFAVLGAPEFKSNVEKAVEAAENGLLREGWRLIKNYGTKRDLSSPKTKLELAVDFTRLFRGVRPGYGPPPPYESVWRGEGRVMGRFTEEVLRLYFSTGVVPDLSEELPDYLGVELNFMARLAFKEASEGGENSCQGNGWRGWQKKFLENHLWPWVPKYLKAMREEACTDFYRGLSFLLEGFLILEKDFLSEKVSQNPVLREQTAAGVSSFGS